MMQTKFANRFCYDRKRVIEITPYYEIFKFHNCKNIVKSTDLRVPRIQGMAVHHLEIKNGMAHYADNSELRINHYNLFKDEINFTLLHKNSIPGTKVDSDESMSRNFKTMEFLCDGKCT